MKVYLVKQWERVEGTIYPCGATLIDTIWSDKEKAENRAKEIYEGFVVEKEVLD